jgi:hypothetical protein
VTKNSYKKTKIGSKPFSEPGNFIKITIRVSSKPERRNRLEARGSVKEKDIDNYVRSDII